MPLVINTNTSATAASNHLDQNNLSLKKSLSRLSSGKRIVSSADDAGGLAVASKLNSTLFRNVRVRESLNNSLSFLQTQAGALQVVGKVLSRMTELKTHSLDISKNDQDYENYNKEFLELQGQLNQISRQKFNGISLFSTNNVMHPINTTVVLRGMSDATISLGTGTATTPGGEPVSYDKFGRNFS